MKLRMSRERFMKNLPDDNDDSGSELAPVAQELHYSLFLFPFSILDDFLSDFLSLFLNLDVHMADGKVNETYNCLLPHFNV